MSAELFGAGLLQEVHEEPLSALLSDLRTIHLPFPESATGLSELDSIVDTCRYPNPGTTHTQPISPNNDIHFEDDLNVDDDQYDESTSPTRNHIRSVTRPKPVIINITQSTNSSTAATSLLLSHLTALAVLPPSYSGKQGAVIHIDCLNNFNSTTLYNRTHSLIRQTDPSTPVATTSQFTRSALSHVHIIPCPCTVSLLQSLRNLPSYLLNATFHPSSIRPLNLLIISGLNHFTWQDRFTTELHRLEQINHHQNSSNQPSDSLPTQILTELKSIQSTFDCTVVYTTTPSNIYNPDPRGTNNAPQQDIYAQSALLTLRATRSDPPQFAPQMSLEECLRDRGRRMEAVRNVRYWVGVGAGGMSENRGRERMGFGMRREGDKWVFES